MRAVDAAEIRTQGERARDAVISWVADRADNRPVALLAQAGIRYEQAVRLTADLPRHAVRRLWGLAASTELVRTLERLSALEYRVRQLELLTEREEER